MEIHPVIRVGWFGLAEFHPSQTNLAEAQSSRLPAAGR
jgi:hypothetical protein